MINSFRSVSAQGFSESENYSEMSGKRGGKGSNDRNRWSVTACPESTSVDREFWLGMPSNLNKCHGFTLIEILVVMVLLGIVTSVAVFTLGSGQQQRELENESKRIHALLRMASEEAILSNTEIGFLIDDEGYEFLEYDDQEFKWGASSVNMLKARSLPEWLSVELVREGDDVKILGKEGDSALKKEKKPEMMLLSSGEVTPFTLTLQVNDNADGQYTIESNGIEPIALKIPGQEDDDE